MRGGQLTAVCTTVDQRERDTEINLDRFIGNIDGELTWGEHDFSRSSRNIHVNGNKLIAVCRTMSGRERKSVLNLDHAMSNINGKLRYDN